jgi:DUF4097 and DUF4098 domain-containing protein YvlB
MSMVWEYKENNMKKGLMMFLCATLLLLMCTSEDNVRDYELQRTETRMWPSTGISQIYSTTVNGQITVSAAADTVITAVITRVCTGSDSIDAEEHIDDIEITESLVSGQLRLEADMPDTSDRDYRADFDITAPSAKYLDLGTVNGDILIQDMIGGARCRVTNGGITTESIRGNIDGATVNGAILCDMAELGANDSALFVTTNGDVTLLLPYDVSAEFDASTTNGVVTITGFSSVAYTIDQTNHKAGTIGSGAGNATIDSGVVNGNITIQAR